MNKLTYNDCVELKSCGFPQTFPDGRFYYDENRDLQYACEDHGDVHPSQTEGIVPTLSELIEECGDDKPTLKPWNVFEWQASVPHKTLRLLIEGKGESPEQAVKNLYCALNKKV